MDRLFTPWRSKYVASDRHKDEGCAFCAKLNADPDNDRENLLVHRGQHTFTLMNIYPYNTGHLLILPYQHVATLIEMGVEAQTEMMLLMSYFTGLLSQVMNPDGFNIGFNLGKAAGAGMVYHVHAHIVPRWNGDSNFMAIVGNTRVLPELLEDTYDKIMAGLRNNPP